MLKYFYFSIFFIIFNEQNNLFLNLKTEYVMNKYTVYLAKVNNIVNKAEHAFIFFIKDDAQYTRSNFIYTTLYNWYNYKENYELELTEGLMDEFAIYQRFVYETTIELEKIGTKPCHERSCSYFMFIF